MTDAQIQRELWGCRYGDLSGMLTLNICHLRKKLEDSQRDHQYIHAVWGHEYGFMPISGN